jgi:hypothetical protein
MTPLPTPMTTMNGKIGFCAATAIVSASSELTANAKNAVSPWKNDDRKMSNYGIAPPT